MGWLGRGRNKAAHEDVAPDEVRPDAGGDLADGDAAEDLPDGALAEAAVDPEQNGAGSGVQRAAYDRSNGPWDITERSQTEGMVDLGALRIPGVDGMQVSLETDQNTKAITGVSVTLNKSALQIQVFAAPRTEGIWDDIRSEIAASVVSDGGSADVIAGVFGQEIQAKLPVTTSAGRKGLRPARFVGIDGPRWFVRGVFSGKAAFDPASAKELDELLSGVIVTRDGEARAPRDTLLLTMPELDHGSAEDDVDQPAKPVTAEDFNPLKRGPEIAEVR